MKVTNIIIILVHAFAKSQHTMHFMAEHLNGQLHGPAYTLHMAVQHTYDRCHVMQSPSLLIPKGKYMYCTRKRILMYESVFSVHVQL